MNLCDEFDDYLSEGRLIEVLRELRDFYKAHKDKRVDNVIMLLSRISKLNENIRLGIVSYQLQTAEINKMTRTAIFLGNEFKEKYCYDETFDLSDYFNRSKEQLDINVENYFPLKAEVEGGSSIDFIEFFNSNELSRLIILGQAGTGKSFLLKKMFLDAIKDTSKTISKIPVLLELKYFQRDTEIVNWIVQKIERKRNFVVEFLRKGRFQVFLDGLDEISPEYIDNAYEEISKTLYDFPEISIIITSREYLYKERGGFSELRKIRIKNPSFSDGNPSLSWQASQGKIELQKEDFYDKYEVVNLQLERVLQLLAFEVLLLKNANSSFSYHEALLIARRFEEKFDERIEVLSYLKQGVKFNILSYEDHLFAFSNVIQFEYFASLYLLKTAFDWQKEELKRYSKYLRQVTFASQEFWNSCLSINKSLFLNDLYIQEQIRFLDRIEKKKTAIKRFLKYIQIAKIKLICSQEDGDIRIIGVSNSALIELFSFVGRFVRSELEIHNEIMISSGYISDLFGISYSLTYRPELIIDYVDNYYVNHMNTINTSQFYFPLYQLIDRELYMRIEKSKYFDRSELDFNRELEYYKRTISLIGEMLIND